MQIETLIQSFHFNIIYNNEQSKPTYIRNNKKNN